MKSHLVLSFSVMVLGAAVMCVWGDSEVKMINSNYSCCKIPEIKSDPKYGTSWSINGRAIANSDNNQCVSPCVDVGRGQIVMEKCIDVNATMVFTNGDNVTEEEKRVSFHGQPCSGSISYKMDTGNQGLCLLAVVIAGLLLNVMI